MFFHILYFHQRKCYTVNSVIAHSVLIYGYKSFDSKLKTRKGTGYLSKVVCFVI